MTSECHGCKYSTTVRKYRRDGAKEGDPPILLCDLCANTPCGNMVEYPTEDKYILQAICYVGNRLLDEIRAACVPKPDKG
jgi:hypothetical protein